MDWKDWVVEALGIVLTIAGIAIVWIGVFLWIVLIVGLAG